MTKKKPPITGTGEGESAAQPWKQIITDTGDVEYIPTDKGRMAYIVTFPADARKPRGRPVEKDWQAVLRWLVVKVSEEGLPKDRGGQAKVAGWVSQWFIDNDLEASMSQINDQVRLIYEEAAKIR
jgi:hypothetical protein